MTFIMALHSNREKIIFISLKLSEWNIQLKKIWIFRSIFGHLNSNFKNIEKRKQRILQFINLFKLHHYNFQQLKHPARHSSDHQIWNDFKINLHNKNDRWRQFFSLNLNSPLCTFSHTHSKLCKIYVGELKLEERQWEKDKQTRSNE